MRITQSMIARNVIQSMNKSRGNLNSIQVAISSGKNIQSPSSDPIDFSRNMRFRTAISKNDRYLRTINNSEGWLRTTSSTLTQIYEQIASAKEIAIQGADDSNSSESRLAMATKINGVLDELTILGNMAYLNKYLFSGTETQGDVPFTRVGDAVSYNGDTGRITRRITDNHSVSININGQQLLDTNMYTAIANLKDALENNDSDAISNSIADLTDAADNVLILSTAIGSIENQTEFAKQRLETANLNLSSFLSQSEDVNMAEAITKYNAEELSYRAALQSASDVIQLNLMQFLK